MLTRTCTECGRVFEPSSGHKQCPSCRSHDLCACGARKVKSSVTCASCRSEAGPHNSNWRGGRTRHKRGYVMIWVPGHPRALTGKGQYVFEHILVMEEILGRYLLPEENVHHRNGAKDDNRPENLELWTRPQPVGIRVNDGIAWAHEILIRYEVPPYSLPVGRLAWACEIQTRIWGTPGGPLGK
jgi:hypothetical protein